MIDWIKNLFSKIPQPNTAIHPDNKKLIEKVETIKGRTLYQFKSLLDMPHKRYNSCTRATTEFNMRLDAETSNKIDDDILNILDSEKIKVTQIASLIKIRQAMTQMFISLDASYRLASVVYFWIDEDLDDYDFEIGDEKIKLFKEIGFDSFFLAKPMNNFLPPMDLSADDLRVYSQTEKELKSLLLQQSKEQSVKSTKAI